MKFIQMECSGGNLILINLDKVTSVTKSGSGGKAVVSFIDCEDYVTLDCTYEEFIDTLTTIKEVGVYGI